MIRNYFFLAILASLMTGCGQQPPETQAAMPGESFTNSYAAAEAALAEATANRNVWSKTEGILTQSKIAYDEGRTEDAIQLANEARLQAELALLQAISQKKDWQANVILE